MIREKRENRWRHGRYELLIRTLGKLKANELKPYLPAVIKAQDVPASLRAASIFALHALDVPPHLVALRAFVKDNEASECRKEAIAILGQVGLDHDDRLLSRIAEQGQVDEIQYTLGEQLAPNEAMRKHDVRAIIWVASMYRHNYGLRNWEDRTELKRITISYGEAALPMMRAMLSSSECKNAAMAVDAVDEIGGEQADKLLAELLNIGGLDVKRSVLSVVKESNSTCPDFLRTYVATHPDDLSAICTVAELDPKDDFCRPAKYLIEGNHANARQVKQILKYGDRALPVLMRVARGTDADRDVRGRAIEALGNFDDNRVIEFLAECFVEHGNDDSLAGSIESAIDRIGDPARGEVYNKLYKLGGRRSADKHLQLASRILADHPRCGQLAKWLPALADDDATNRIEAVKAMKELGAIAEPALQIAKRDRNPAVSSLVD